MRNKLTLVTLLLCAGIVSYAQNYNPVEIPCKKVNSATFFQFNGIIESTCIEDLPSVPLPIHIAGNQDVELKASEEIFLDNEVWIHPNPNGEFYAHIETFDLNLAWYDPILTPGVVGLYKKLEIGVEIPDNILQEIENYLSNTGVMKLNPFNPEDIELRAEFSHNAQPNGTGTWENPLLVYGFYYEEYTENTSDLLPRNWTLDNILSGHKFRVRFAPPQTGIWKCKITLVTKKDSPQENIFNASEFTFGCTPSNDPGYVKVASNNKYFQIGNETFFPSGRNIPQPDLTSNNISANANYQIVDVENYNGYDNRKINPAYHKTYRDDLTSFKNAGGKYFRTLFYGDWYEIEFEKLNNYYDRLNTAWEFDRFIDHCEALDLKLDFCLSNYEYGQLKGDFTQNWDWYSPVQQFADPNSDPDCVSDPLNPKGYCYNTDLGITSPEEFLTDASAIKHYQNRLRYIVSRWSYSTSIAIMMLQAEMNNHAKYNVLVQNPTCKTVDVYYGYNTLGGNYLEAISFWQNEMCKFLKTDQYFPHLTSVNYTGCPRKIYDQQSDSDNYAIQNGDDSYYSEYVDVATYDQYENFWSKFNSMFNNVADLTDYGDLFINYAPAINKPIMVAETGDDAAQHCDFGISYIKDAWVSSFTGLAGSAMLWGYQYQYSLMQYNQKVEDFFNGINMYSINWRPVRDERNDYKATLYALISDENQTRAMGIIDNQTANQFTLGQNHCGYLLSDIVTTDNEDNYQFPLASSVSFGNFGNALSLPNMGNKKKYVIDYYNAITMDLIDFEIKKSQSDGDLKLEHPILSTGFGNNSFLIAFKVRRFGEPSFYNPADSLLFSNDNLLAELETINTTETLPVSEKTNPEPFFELIPNPAENLVNIHFNNPENEKATIYLIDTKGALQNTLEIYTDFAIFDITKQAQGIYFVVLEINGSREYKKLVKL